MNTKQKTISLLVLVTSIFISGCGLGQLFGPAFTPTPEAIVGIEIPIIMDGAGLLVVAATNDRPLLEFKGMLILFETQPEETLFFVKVLLVSGDIVPDPYNLNISLIDDKGNQYPPRATYLTDDKTGWLFNFIVPKASKSFVAQLQDGQTIKLDSILKMVP